MAEEGAWKVQGSWKHGFNSLDMINIRADSVDEYLAMVDQLSNNSEVLAGAANDFKARHAVDAAFPGAEEIPFDGAKPAQPDVTTGGKICAHGKPYKFQQGEKNGKKWAGYFCQVENDPALPKCKPIWQN